MCNIAHIYLDKYIFIYYYCVIMHIDMSDYERKKVETDLKAFTSRNFVKPSECKNLDQIRFYVRELCSRIEALEGSCHYVPGWAYSLLAQYNATQNRMLHAEFRNAYSR